MCGHPITRNVGTDIAVQLGESVVSKLEGTVMGTFSIVTSTIQQVLQAQHHIGMLWNIMALQHCQHPCVVTFCGGVE